MSQHTPPPLRSKVRMPALTSNAVHRGDVIAALRERNAPVWLISAPAGYGKTTLVRQAVEEVDGRICWVNLDRADNDPTRFWRHVVAAVLAPGTELDTALEQLDAASVEESADVLAAILEAAPGPIVLVLDDLHEVARPEIHDGLGQLLTRPAAQLTVIIATRADPPLPLGKLRTQGRLAEARVGDLQFTREEAGELFGGSLEPDELQAVHDGTEGWATALRLLVASIDEKRSAGDLLRAAKDGHSDLAEFLRGEVLERLDPDDTRFVIETSLLDVLEPGLCDQLTGRTDSLVLLRRLTHDHVFTQLIDQSTNTYRFHPLFGAFLRARAEELPAEHRRQIHEQAAEWYARRDDPTAAITHALAAGADDLALQTMKANFLAYAQAGLLTTVDGWLTAYGHSRCRQDAQLCMMAAWAALNHHRYDEIDEWLEAAAHDTSADRQAEVHTVRSNRARHDGDLAQAQEQARWAVDALTDRASGLASAAHAALGAALVLSGSSPGDHLRAAVTLGCANGVDSSVVTGYSYLALASSRDPQGTEDTRGMADQALTMASTPVLERFHQPAAAWLAKARAALDDGLLADATEAASSAAAMASAGEDPLLLALVSCVSARIAHQRGHEDRARSAVRDAAEQAGSAAGGWIDAEIRATRNAIRFAAVEAGSAPNGAPELSPKEREIIALLPVGLSRRDLAGQLFISENTLKTHLTSIRHKLGVERGDDLLDRIAELGLVRTDG